MALHALHLCSGYGGFELALREWGVRTVCHVERDAHAAATLVARMEEAHLDRAPIWDDLTTFDGRPWRGRVDIVTAGFPCQPFSAAGQRRGLDDERWIWPDIARIIRDVGPRFVILENVPGLVRHGLPSVLNDLAALGFNAEWGLLSAAAIGAPHKRERVWIVAHRNSDGWGTPRRNSSWDPNVVSSRGAVVGNGVRSGRERETGTERGLSVSDVSSRRVAHAGGIRPETIHAVPVPSGAGYSRPGVSGGAMEHEWPPLPRDAEAWAEWVAAGNAEPVIRGGIDGSTGRMVGGVEIGERLHLLGNGLVPQCATEAIRQLLGRAGWVLNETEKGEQHDCSS